MHNELLLHSECLAPPSEAEQLMRRAGGRAVAVTQNKESVMNVAEIELYDLNGTTSVDSRAVILIFCSAYRWSRGCCWSLNGVIWTRREHCTHPSNLLESPWAQ